MTKRAPPSLTDESRPNRYREEFQGAGQIALAAGRLIKEGFSSAFSVSHKGTVDLVTEIDLASEHLIKKALSRSFPDDAFFGEEGGGADYRQGRVWVVDPLDGTTNFAHHLPIFSVSIGFFDRGKVRVGAVFQPMTDELFLAREGGGSTMNGRPIHVSKTRKLIEALGVTGFPYRIHDCLDPLLANLRTIMPLAQGIRRLGSAAMDLCYVASGTFDFFWEIKLNPWDVAAGSLILTEAGGKITDYLGKPDFIARSELLASNGLLHADLLKFLHTSG